MIVFIILLVGIPLIGIVWTIIREYRKPKWLKVYEYVIHNIKQINLDDESDVAMLQASLEVFFKIPESQSYQCVFSYKYRWWYKQNIT